MTESTRAGSQRLAPLGANQRAARLRGPLKWGLLATLLASVVSLVWPTHSVVIAQGRDIGTARVGDVMAAQSSQVVVVQSAPAASPGAVANLQQLGEAGAAPSAQSFDPFVGVVTAPPPAPAQIVQPVAVAAAAPAPPPQEYRFLGRVLGPDGVEQVFLSRGDSSVSISTGTVLDNGYVVESIAADSIALRFPPLNARAAISIPGDQSAQ